ncbi:MAG: nucleotide exchange factor GrpE [Nocardioidaceae bacterium]
MTFDPNEFGPEGMVFRDKRRIDPETGEVREPQPSAAPSADEPAPGQPAEPATDDSAVSDAEAAIAERTADLQRLQAEYVNYKRRVDRDREAVRESAVASVLTSLLPVLDDIGRARDHDELTGGFKAVAESLERAVSGLGLAPFGEVGDPFDPRIHEALMHSYSDEVDGPVCQAVLQVGYRLGDRIIRPARVAVAEPATGSEQAAPTSEAAAPPTEAAAGPTEAGAAPTEAGAAPTEAGAAPTEAGAGPTEAGTAGPPPQTSYTSDVHWSRGDNSDPATDRD